ncbi:unnamed protein product [Didymodactylos carnosus]|uniref:Peptidase S53 domain-containing protein n=2 Tax=Didymodactylos carnosus TaxID=1234261 RepID=A0A815CV52_9BILA|nr:unnamed protein product [Didymodactylos carnosus]CAF4100306.1 unnamed protein product [Didymodactylos carnosus]
MMEIGSLKVLYTCILLILVLNYSSSVIGGTIKVSVSHKYWRLLADSKPRPNENIKLIFVIKNNDTQVSNLEQKFKQVSDPVHADYGNFLTYDEIHQQLLSETTKNGKIVETWLKKHNMSHITSTAHKEFLIVQSSVRLIEQLLQTTFLTYQHRTKQQLTFRAKQFNLPSTVYDKIDYIDQSSELLTVSGSKIPASSESPSKHPLAVDSPSNAPNLLFLDRSGKRIEFFIQLICSNGENASDTVCPEFRGYEITLIVLSATTQQTVSLAEANCQVCYEAGASIFDACFNYNLNDDSVLCRFYISNINIQKYQQITVYVQSKFVMDGETTYSLPASQPFEQVPHVTPSLLASLYKVNMSIIKQKRLAKSRQAVVGFGQYYNLKSYKAFSQSYGKNFNIRIGKVYGEDYTNKSYDEGETTLDMEYMAAMGAGIVTDYISSKNDEVSFTPFFTKLALLESDKRNIVPLVYSISYGLDSKEAGLKIVRMNDIQFMKLGVSGKTVFVSAGDDGVSSSKGCTKRFIAVYPASSPYITSVGATQLILGDKSNCRYIPQERSKCLEEIVAYTNDLTECSITSGGGFSIYHTRPTWQKAMVQNYLSTAKKRLPPLTYFKKNNRAYPDITLLGHDYSTKEKGGKDNAFEDGTSASSPATAGLFSLINDQRLKLGLKPLGFVNPLLYQLAKTNPEAFYDIVKGKNNCNTQSVCCPYGFEAQKGYDPVTGIGSINHELLMKLLTEK